MTSDVLIAIGGEYGTLSEIALGLKAGKPVISMKVGWEVKGVLIADNAKDAVDMAFKSHEKNILPERYES